MKDLLRREWQKAKKQARAQSRIRALALLGRRLFHLTTSYARGRFYFRQAQWKGRLVFAKGRPAVFQQGKMKLGNLVRIWSNINPTQLIAGSKAVYGEEKFARFYGELIPVSEERVIVAEDGDKIQLEGRSLEFRHTPGHAEHHFCVWDACSEGWFSGDTFGISYLTMGDKQGAANRIGRFIIPTTSPVQFDPDKLLASINLMMSYGPKRFYLTHYSVLEQPEQQAELLRGQIEDYRQIALSCADEPAEPEEAQEQQLFQAIREKTLNRIASTHPALNLDEMDKLLTMDFELNAQGLKVWLAKQK